MYNKFFGLTRKPFAISADPNFLFWSVTHRHAYSMLQYGITHQAGITVISGSVGCGKTTIINKLLNWIPSNCTVGTLSTLHANVSNLESWVLKAFGQPFEGGSEVELLDRLERFLLQENKEGRRCILIIDEAQNLGAALLERLRTYSNFTYKSQQLLQLILAGQPQLRDLLNRPDMVQFAQRVSSDYHISPFDAADTKNYIEARLKHAGSTRTIFHDNAIQKIYEVSGGVPRLINIICDTAMVYAYSLNSTMVSDAIIDRLVKDKQNHGVFAYGNSLRADPQPGEALPPAAIVDPQVTTGATEKPALVINDPALAQKLLDKLSEL